MKTMRQLITLMENVSAVPGLDASKIDRQHDNSLEENFNKLKPWQTDAIAQIYIHKLGKTPFINKAMQDTIDSLYAGGVIGSKDIPAVRQYLENFNKDETFSNKSEQESDDEYYDKLISDYENQDVGSEFDPKLGENLRLHEKSKSEKQARFMAAAAHDPKFAKKAGIDSSVAKEFNKADTGTKQLSNAMKKVKESEADMQTASTSAVDSADASFDAAQGNAIEVDEDYGYHGDSSDFTEGIIDVGDEDEYSDDYSLNTGNKQYHRPADYSTVSISKPSKNNYNRPKSYKRSVGDEVVHPKYGKCTVVSIKKDTSNYYSRPLRPQDEGYYDYLTIIDKHGQEFQVASGDLYDTNAMDEDMKLNNGYDNIKVANGQDFFPDGADSPVVRATGPSGARQGDNPEQKKMQVAEVHKELVYGYRNYLKETAKSALK